MRKNYSHSLPKIDTNIRSSRKVSRIQPNSYIRLNFPQIGDSGYYGNAGRKHYLKNSEFIHRLILNPDYGKQSQNIPRSKSQAYLKQYPKPLQKQKKIVETQQTPLPDSLTKLQEQFNKKLNTQDSPQKNQKTIQIPIIPNTQIPNRKSPNPEPYHDITSHFKLFGSVDNYFNAIHNSNNSQQYNYTSKRKLNPTFLSSQLGYV